MSAELRTMDVFLRYGFDVWASGMTLLAVADVVHSLEAINRNDENVDPRLYTISYDSDPTDAGQLMQIHNPRPDEILSCPLTAKFYVILDVVFRAEPKRLTAEDVVELVVALEVPRKQGLQRAHIQGGSPFWSRFEVGMVG